MFLVGRKMIYLSLTAVDSSRLRVDFLQERGEIWVYRGRLLRETVPESRVKVDLSLLGVDIFKEEEYSKGEQPSWLINRGRFGSTQDRLFLR